MSAWTLGPWTNEAGCISGTTSTTYPRRVRWWTREIPDGGERRVAAEVALGEVEVYAPDSGDDGPLYTRLDSGPSAEAWADSLLDPLTPPAETS